MTVPRSLIYVLLEDQTLPDNTFFLKLEHSLDQWFELIPANGLLLLHEVGRRPIRSPSVLLPPELFLVKCEIFGVLIFLIFGELWDTWNSEFLIYFKMNFVEIWDTWNSYILDFDEEYQNSIMKHEFLKKFGTFGILIFLLSRWWFWVRFEIFGILIIFINRKLLRFEIFSSILIVLINIIWEIQFASGAQSGRSGRKRSPGWGVALAATSPQPGARTLRMLQENSIDFILGAGEETSLYLPWS